MTIVIEKICYVFVFSFALRRRDIRCDGLCRINVGEPAVCEFSLVGLGISVADIYLNRAASKVYGSSEARCVC